jgi:DNA-binding transcriptional regulator YiaG
MKRKDTPDGFWARVDIRGPDECWPWKGKPERNGYGRVRWHGRKPGAHRVSYELTKGPIRAGYKACHTCDNPPCCNPAHLFEGTDLDNMRDKAEKGRAARGLTNRNSKLTPKKVRALRFLYRSGQFSQDDLAETFDVTRENVQHIVNGRTWKHVTD